MKRIKRERHPRVKLVFTILAALAASAAFMALSFWMRPSPTLVASPTTTSAPASAPARLPPDSKNVATQNLSGMLLLFGLTCLLIAAAFTIMLIADIRKSRPAWQTQHKYPKRH